MKIRNYASLAHTSIRKHALDVASAGVIAALPFTYFSQYVTYTHKKLKIKDQVFINLNFTKSTSINLHSLLPLKPV